jgi:hypothetical protein
MVCQGLVQSPCTTACLSKCAQQSLLSSSTLSGVPHSRQGPILLLLLLLLLLLPLSHIAHDRQFEGAACAQLQNTRQPTSKQAGSCRLISRLHVSIRAMQHWALLGLLLSGWALWPVT